MVGESRHLDEDRGDLGLPASLLGVGDASASASPAAVGGSKSRRRGSSTCRLSRSRETTWVASSEWPPRSKKSS